MESHCGDLCVRHVVSSTSASPTSGNLSPFVFLGAFSLGHEILLDLSRGFSFSKGAVSLRIATHGKLVSHHDIARGVSSEEVISGAEAHGSHSGNTDVEGHVVLGG